MQNIDEKKLKAQKAYVNIYYEDNVFFQSNPDMFFKLWQLLKEHEDSWSNKLENNLEYAKLKSWLMTLFVNETNKSRMALQSEDIAKLVINNITKLPNGCKCKLRDLSTKVD